MKEVKLINLYRFFSARFKFFISIAYEVLFFNARKRCEINKKSLVLDRIIINAEI
jgi:hypothetical protein